MEKYMPPYQSSTPLDENLIIFWSFPDFSASALAFWEYIKKNTSFETVWIIENADIYEKLDQEEVKCCLRENKNCAEWLSKAKYVVYGDVRRNYFPKPIGQINIFIRHSMSMVCDVCLIYPMNDFMQEYAYRFKIWGTIADIYPVSSEIQRVINAGICYMEPRKVFITGMPRTDLIIHSDGKNILTSVLPELKSYNKLAFYCPTMRTGRGGMDVGPQFDDNIFNLDDFNREAVEKILEDNNAAVVFKMHPADEAYFNNNKKSFPLPKHCYIIDSYTFWPKSFYHVLNAFDLVITDFASIANEFLLLDRPVIYNHTAKDKFAENFRLVIEDDELLFPGEIYSDLNGFKQAFQSAVDSPDKYYEKRIKTKNLYHKYTDGKSCERLFNLMQNFTPVENMDYEMFVLPLEKQINSMKENLNSKEEQINSMEDQLNSKENQLNIMNGQLNSRTFRYSKNFVQFVCPPNSIRCRFANRILKLFRKS